MRVERRMPVVGIEQWQVAVYWASGSIPAKLVQTLLANTAHWARRTSFKVNNLNLDSPSGSIQHRNSLDHAWV